MSKLKKGNEIINWYQEMPKSFLDTPDNPNFHLHQMKIPFRLCCVAPSGSGKSNLILNLIHLFSSGKKGTFSSIFIITKNKNEPLYNYLVSKAPQIMIKEGLENAPQLDKFDKTESHLVIFDDLVLSKNLDIVSNWFIRCRKQSISACFLSQSYFKIPPIIRSNCSYMVILKLGGIREINMILATYGLGVTKQELINMYEYATKEKFSPLIIDLEESSEKRFRKGFLEILNPDEFS